MKRARVDRFTGTIIAIALVAGCVGVFLFLDLYRSQQDSRRNYAGAVHGLDLIGELQYQAQEARRTLLYALSTTDSNLQVGYADQSRAAESQVAQRLDEYAQLALARKDAAPAAPLAKDWAAYLAVRDELIAAMLEGDPKAAVARDLRDGVPAFNALRVDLEKTKELLKKDAGELLRAAALGMPPGFEVFVAAARRGEAETREWTYLRKDGARIPVSLTVTAMRDHAGTVAGFIGIATDISARQRADGELRRLNAQLLETSRMAGMAEVATGVLHNVGNVLNSVNVSAGIVLEKLRRSKVPKLGQAAGLLTGRNGGLAEYLTEDASGRKLPGYLAKLGQHLVAENTELLGEVDQLSRNIEHIKEIVAMQQSYAKVSGVFENLPADRLVEDSIAMNVGAFERHGVLLDRRFSTAPPVRVDRHRVLQILINLIRNAKYALDDAQRTDKRITISIAPADGKSVCIVVADNGIGISPENLTRVFGHGFTTRQDGHGFGLHSGALATKEMGGSLSVRSAGHGHGAAFTLTLPIAATASHL